MNAKLLSILIGLVAISNVHADGLYTKTLKGVVVERSERPVLTGLVRTFVEISVTEQPGSLSKVLIPYMVEEQRLPKIGRVCKFHYHLADIEGAVGRPILKIADANVVDRFKCAGEKTVLTKW